MSTWKRWVQASIKESCDMIQSVSKNSNKFY